MRRKEQELKDFDQIEDIIRQSSVCRLGLCDNGTPYVVPLNFGYREKKLYFHCAKEGRKIDIMRANPTVCFEFDLDLGMEKADKACNWGNNYKSVIGTGKASFVEDAAGKVKALEIIMQNYSDEKHVFPEKAVENTCVFFVEMEEVSGKESS